MLQITFIVLLAMTGCMAADPTPCCTDRQFQAVISRIGGSAYPLTGNTVFIDGYQETAYDFYRKRIGALWHQLQPDGSYKNVSYLVDYSTDRQYVYDDGKCTVTKIGQPMQPPCIPSNATFLATSSLGFGTESLTINTFGYMQGGVAVRVSVTDNGCVPVLGATYGIINKVATDIVEVFSSFKPGIDDPSTMDPTQYDSMCTFVDKDQITDSSSTVIGRRSVFVGNFD